MINMDKFFRYHKAIVVRQPQDGSGTIVCGSRDAVYDTKQQTPPPIDAVLIEPTSDGVVVLHSLEEKKLICLLASTRRLVTPLSVGGLSSDDVEWLQKNYDVAFELQPHGLYNLI